MHIVSVLMELFIFNLKIMCFKQMEINFMESNQIRSHLFAHHINM